jgi:hypothetical protein
MSSVAWTNPEIVKWSEKNSRVVDGAVLRRFRFWRPTEAHWEEVEVTKDLCRLHPSSKDVGETWPALLEKAYVKWRTGVDNPVDAASYASVFPTTPSLALESLVPFQLDSHVVSEMTPESIYKLLRSNSFPLTRLPGPAEFVKVFNPIVAYTLPDGDALSRDDFEAKGLSPDHAYSVLGFGEEGKLIVRDPMGGGSRTLLNPMTGRHSVLQADCDIYLREAYAVFAISLDDFKTYFRGIDLAVDVQGYVPYCWEMRDL